MSVLVVLFQITAEKRVLFGSGVFEKMELSNKLQYVKYLLDLWQFLTRKIVKYVAVSEAVASTPTIFMKQVAASSIIWYGVAERQHARGEYGEGNGGEL